jgi:hypothetical protein
MSGMSERRPRSAAPTEIDFYIEARRFAGGSQGVIAGELGLSTGAIVARLKKMARYRSGEQLLAEDSQSVEGFTRTGIISWTAGRVLREYSVERLCQLCDWSQAELLRCPGIGVRTVDVIKGLMAQHQLKLHPDRPTADERSPKWMQRYTAFMASRLEAPGAPAACQVDNVVYVDFRRRRH